MAMPPMVSAAVARVLVVRFGVLALKPLINGAYGTATLCSTEVLDLRCCIT
jgi:hypothetical protein